MLRARRMKPPRPSGSQVHDHAVLAGVLRDITTHGPVVLSESLTQIQQYRDQLADVDPNDQSRDEALAYWINLYNAGALHRAGEAYSRDYSSVLRVPGAFDETWVTVAGVDMSLDDIEHGIIRRFKDPRIHGALVCGSVSCPTLSSTPFTGSDIDDQLDRQMRSYLSRGGATLDQTTNTLRLSRVLKWYGGDFVWPETMPTLRPARPKRTATSIAQWLSESDADWIDEHRPSVVFAPYDWGLGCSIA